MIPTLNNLNDADARSFKAEPDNLADYGVRTSVNGYVRGKFTSRVEKFVAGEDLTAGQPAFLSLGGDSDIDEAGALSWYTRPTTADAWTEQGSRPSTYYTGIATYEEVGFKLDAGVTKYTVHSAKFTVLRGSGSSRGTDYADVTMRVYELDGSGDPVAAHTGEILQSFDPYQQNPAVTYTVVFDTPLVVDGNSEFLLSMQYSSTDGDDITVSAITAVITAAAGSILASDVNDPNRQKFDGIVTADCLAGADCWLDLGNAFSGIPNLKELELFAENPYANTSYWDRTTSPTNSTTPSTATWSVRAARNDIGYDTYGREVLLKFDLTAAQFGVSGVRMEFDRLTNTTSEGSIYVTVRLYELDASGDPIDTTTPLAEKEVFIDIRNNSGGGYAYEGDYNWDFDDIVDIDNVHGVGVAISHYYVGYRYNYDLLNIRLKTVKDAVLEAGKDYYLQSGGVLSQEVSLVKLGMAYNSDSLLLLKKVGDHEQLFIDEGNNSMSHTTTFEKSGFAYGWAQNTGSSAFVYYTPVGGSSIEIVDAHANGDSRVAFCIPVQAGDVISLSSSDGNGALYFKEF